jgi:hypothetical protein
MKNYLQISPYVYNCKVCQTRCDAISKMVYSFKDDLQFSEHYENNLIRYINDNTAFTAQKTIKKGYPDVLVRNSKGEKFYIEVKVQRRTFMTVEHILPRSGLKPSETVALNLSDLKRYFELVSSSKIHVFIFWVVLNRPCILGDRPVEFYYALVSDLKQIWQREKSKRQFRRKSGEGDEVEGKHLGVTLNYHFSLKELKRWNGRLF